MKKTLASFLTLIALAPPASAFVCLSPAGGDPTNPLRCVRWTNGFARASTFLGNAGEQLLNGTFTWDDNLINAALDWNRLGAGFQFQVARGGNFIDPCGRRGSGHACTDTGPEGDNPIFFTRSICGAGFGDIIAQTTNCFDPVDVNSRMVNSPIFFNLNESWNAYDGPLRFDGILDIRRVAIHELGHVLGLTHPDNEGEVVRAIMNRRVSNLDRLQDDDIEGVRFLYAGGVPPTGIPEGASTGCHIAGSGSAGTAWSLLLAAGLVVVRRRFVGQPQSPARGLLAAIGLFACFAAGCGDDDDFAAPRATGEFLALTYNVAGLPEGLSDSHPALNTPQISPLLNRYDMVLVQESWLTPDELPPFLTRFRTFHDVLVADADHPFKSQPLAWPLNQDPERPSAVVSDGLNRLSRFPLGEVERRRWRDCDNSAADCLSLKGFSVARTTLADGVEVDVYNLHMEAGNTEHDQELKIANIRAVIALIDDFSSGRAVIVGGDFNMKLRRESDAAGLALLAEEAGLQDACIALGTLDENEIDKFFFRSSDRLQLTATSCRFEVELFSDADGQPLSDHDPLAVGFEWAVLR